MKCPVCGQQNSSEATRCRQCGATILPGEGEPEVEDASTMETLLLFGGALIVVCGVLGFVFQNEIRNYLWPEESTEIKCISQQRARLSHDFTPEHGWQRMPDSPLRPNEVCFERPLAQGGTSLSAPTPSSAPADRATPSAKEAPAKEAPPALPEPSGEDDDAPMFPEE